MSTATKSLVGRHDAGRRGRFYYLEDGAAFPSVTNILSVVNKPALMHWAANAERTLVMQAAANLYEDIHGTPQLKRLAYLDTLKRRLGTEKAHQKELAKACEIGSSVHELIEWNLRKELGQKVGPQPTLTGKALHAFSVYQTWRETAGIRPALIEQTVWSREHQYAGTADLVAMSNEYPNKLIVTDWKTGKAIYEEALLQVSAYGHALIEMGHAEPGGVVGMIVRLPKAETDPDPEFRVIPPAEMATLFDSFLNVRAVWQFVQDYNRWIEGVDKPKSLKTNGTTTPEGLETADRSTL